MCTTVKLIPISDIVFPRMHHVGIASDLESSSVRILAPGDEQITKILSIFSPFCPKWKSMNFRVFWHVHAHANVEIYNASYVFWCKTCVLESKCAPVSDRNLYVHAHVRILSDGHGNMTKSFVMGTFYPTSMIMILRVRACARLFINAVFNITMRAVLLTIQSGAL